ncbi:glycosyltransferase [Helicobacter sp.]|uniref:glycosyltransferase n=1 Tax=Helicobacter sp. TaxID=218 RepID=UPI002A759108|nr:glycosyltransferase [Helicobacter sp.]MDY2585572.1 glycosyltransferase [Helicobacter sp.]
MARVIAKQNKVGIVIPVYNTPLEYFRECLEGALNQDYRDLEILIVHDGDYTPCVEVSLEYASRDPRITVIVKPINEGVSIARNIGIDYFSGALEYRENKEMQVEFGAFIAFSVKNANPYAIGVIYKSKAALIKAKKLTPLKIDYIYFLDSDDVCHKDLVSSCLKHAKGASLVWFSFDKITESGAEHLGEHINDLDILSTSRMITPQDWLSHGKEVGYGSAIFVWQVFIDFKFLKESKLRFLNQVMREDNLFGVCLLLECKKMYALSEKLIDYRVRTNGETNFAIDTDKVFLPGFLRPLFEAFGGDLLLTKHFYVALSWFIQKLYFLDFIQKHTDKQNLNVIAGGMLNRFQNESMKFIHLRFQLDTDYYFNICFNIFLSYIAALPNYDPYYRPFDKLAEYIMPNTNSQQETIRLMKEVLMCENTIIVDKNKMIEDLTERVRELESQNTELKAKLKK